MVVIKFMRVALTTVGFLFHIFQQSVSSYFKRNVVYGENSNTPFRMTLFMYVAKSMMAKTKSLALHIIIVARLCIFQGVQIPLERQAA